MNPGFAILNSAPVGCCVVDQNLRIVFWNKVLENWTGLLQEEIAGRSLIALYPELGASKNLNRIQTTLNAGAPALFSSRITPHFIPCPRADGSLRTQQTLVSRLPDSTPEEPLALITLTDLSDQADKVASYRNARDRAKQAEQKVQEYALELEDKNEKLNRYMADLKQSNEDLDNFAHIASLDLRAPLRAVSNLATWLSEDLAEIAPESALQDLALMKQRGGRLESMVDDILRFARAGRHREKPTEVDTGALAHDIYELLNPDKKFHFKVSLEMPRFVTLRTPLELVFRNLIDNAIKHHDGSGGSIYIAGAREDEFFTFSVTDDGPGISPEQRSNIFQPFGNEGSPNNLEVCGLGLATVKRTVERFGGDILLDSTPGKATTFRFRWPASIAGAA